MIQGGDPEGVGSGGPATASAARSRQTALTIPSPQPRRVSMARTMAPNSAGSQFFIMHEDARISTASTLPSARSLRASRKSIRSVPSVPTTMTSRVSPGHEEGHGRHSRRRLSRTGKRIIHLPYPYNRFFYVLYKSESWAFTFERSIDTAGFPNEFIA